jgi:hypothetical protein
MGQLVVKLGSVSAPLSAPSHYIDSCVSNLREYFSDYACKGTAVGLFNCLMSNASKLLSAQWHVAVNGLLDHIGECLTKWKMNK